MPDPLIIFPGQVFDRLTVISKAYTKTKFTAWDVSCLCGNITILTSNKLAPSYRAKHKLSCGNCQDNIKHKLTYNSWQNMLKRCYYKGAINYANYGGRGIEVCQRWRKDFLFFLEDMGERPSEFYSIDRIDVNGNYEPSNCKWSSASEQRINQRF